MFVNTMLRELILSTKKTVFGRNGPFTVRKHPIIYQGNVKKLMYIYLCPISQIRNSWEMKRLCVRIGFFLAFSCSICFGQIFDNTKEKPYKRVFVDTDNFGVSYLSILEDALGKVGNDTLRFCILNDLAYYWHTRNLTTSMDFTKRGLRSAAQKKDILWEGRFQITQGAVLLRMEKLDSACTVLELAKNKVKESDLPFLHTQLGYVYERKGQLDRAADEAMISLKLGEKRNDTKAIALAYSDLSNLLWKQSKYEKGLEYGLKSIDIFEERGMSDLDYDFTLYVVGNNYLALKDYEKAQHYYEHAAVLGERYGFYNNLSDVYISLVDLYTDLEEYDKAETAGEKTIAYAELLQNDFMLMRSWLSMGKMQNKRANYAMAVESLQKCIEVATEDFGDAFYLSQAYEQLGKALAGNHQYMQAYEAFAEYDKLKKVIFTVEADQRISLLQTELGVAQKESTIQLQELKLKKQATVQVLLIIITGLLFLFLVFLYKTIQNNRKKNKQLERQNEEKEFLLKEIHHRVKNNLEIVSSLLALQSAHLDDPKIADAMQKSRDRIHSMSMIHQKLYQEKSLSSIEMKDYFENLASYIVAVFGAEDQVKVLLEMEPVTLDVDTAVPIGLIVNELLTNALKYAFPYKKEGTIRIGLKREDTQLRLWVADDGIGKSEMRKTRGTGFGTQLIALLIQQLDGKMELLIDKGTIVNFEFQYHKAA